MVPELDSVWTLTLTAMQRKYLSLILFSRNDRRAGATVFAPSCLHLEVSAARRPQHHRARARSKGQEAAGFSEALMVAAAQVQGDFAMGPEKNVFDDLRARVARLEREVQSRDSYIDGLILRNRGLRIDVYKHQAEVLRLRRVLRQAGLSEAANESATRIAVATALFEPDAESPPTRRKPRNSQ